jgi:flap endonuclease-1
MGVKLKDLVSRKPIDLKELAGRVVAIDAPNIIMGLFNFARKNPDGTHAGLLLDKTQRPIAHLFGLLYRMNFYFSKKIFPIFVFDGRDSDLKRLITKDKLNDFRFTDKWYRQALASGDKTLARKIALSREYMWQNILHESKQLLSSLGVPYLESPASAESQCAHLVKEKIVYYSNSQDYDSLLFGCPRMLQNLTKSLSRKVQGRWVYQKITPYEINLRDTLSTLKINQFQLVDMAILIGTDYFEGIRNIGPKTALKLIFQYKNIESVIRHLKDKFDFSKLSQELIHQVRKIFLFPEVRKVVNFSWNYPNESKVRELFFKEHNLEVKRMENNLEKFIINFEKCRTYFENYKGMPRKVQKTLI